jgi:hypothetical protein
VLLESVAELKRFRLDKLVCADFEPDQAAPTNPVQIVKQWILCSPSKWLVYGAIASQGEAVADSANLIRQRLRAVETLLTGSGLSQADPALTSEVLPAVPELLSIGEQDGIIVLTTHPGA